MFERSERVNNRKMAKLEKKVPELAVAALDAASERAAISAIPRVLVIENGLYRVSASGEKELIRTLPPRIKVSGHTKRSKS
jgi:hypothetical protein